MKSDLKNNISFLSNSTPSLYKGSFFITGFDRTKSIFIVGLLRDNQVVQIGSFKKGLGVDEKNALIQTISDNQIKIENEVIYIQPGICVELEFKSIRNNQLLSPEFLSFRFDISWQECTWGHLLFCNSNINKAIKITHPDKPIWENPLVTKDQFISYLIEISPYMLPFLNQKALTVIRYPHGTIGEAFYQKNCPDYAPEFINTFSKEGINYIMCNDLSSLIWLGNQLAIEYHIPFQTINNENPIEIVFDLDPPSRDYFNLAVKAALEMKEIFDTFGIESYPKLSGNKGIQIHIPIINSNLTFKDTKFFTTFIAEYLVEKMPDIFTIERLKKNRGNKLYIDHVQFAEGKTIICPYSTRGKEISTVAAPLYWEEVNKNLRVEDYTIGCVLERISIKGCPFRDYFDQSNEQLGTIIREIVANKS